MLRWNSITKIFKTDLLQPEFVALNDVSFEIPDGSMVGFLGANGAGKTTSIKIALDFIATTSGNIHYDEKLGNNKTEIFKNIGYLPERPYYYPHLKGREFITFMGELSGLSRAEIGKKIDELSKKFRIDHALDRELKTYSKGMLQRIGFLVTVLHDPKMIILDEPLSGLDPIGRKEMKNIMVDLHNEGKTVFFSSHIVSDVEEICDRAVFLRKGKLIYDGAVAPLLESHSRAAWKIIVPAGSTSSLSLLNKKALSGGLESWEVSTELKDRLISDISSRGIAIMGLEQVKPHLEEIFYETRKND